LESTWEALEVKQFDVEFSVDPLFKKTSAEFDEGGASGLLLSHLQIDQNGRIIFDSSDSISDLQEQKSPSVNINQSQASDSSCSISGLKGNFKKKTFN